MGTVNVPNLGMAGPGDLGCPWKLQWNELVLEAVAAGCESRGRHWERVLDCPQGSEPDLQLQTSSRSTSEGAGTFWSSLCILALDGGMGWLHGWGDTDPKSSSDP